MGCARRASRQPWGAGWCPGRTACRLSRTSLPSASPWGLCWGLGSLSPAGLPASRRTALGAALVAGPNAPRWCRLQGTDARPWVQGGWRQGLHGPQLAWTGPGSAPQPRRRLQPAAGSGAPACSGGRSLDSCSDSVACLSFHGVSILQPPSVLIPGGRGRGCLPWHRVAGAGIQAALGMPGSCVQQQF